MKARVFRAETTLVALPPEALTQLLLALPEDQRTEWQRRLNPILVTSQQAIDHGTLAGSSDMKEVVVKRMIGELGRAIFQRIEPLWTWFDWEYDLNGLTPPPDETTVVPYAERMTKDSWRVR